MHLRWGKQHGTLRKTKHRGIARVATDFLLNSCSLSTKRRGRYPSESGVLD
jgi:hypothetical protein